MERGEEQEFTCKVAKGAIKGSSVKGRRRMWEEFRWEITGALQIFMRAASLCTWCIKVVDDSVWRGTSSMYGGLINEQAQDAHYGMHMVLASGKSYNLQSAL